MRNRSIGNMSSSSDISLEENYPKYEEYQFYCATPLTSKFKSRFLRFRYPLVTNSGSSCSCQSSFSCVYPAGIYTQLRAVDALYQEGILDTSIRPNATLLGMSVGCFPLNTLLQSTLECLFSDVCLAVLQSAYPDRPLLTVTPLRNDTGSRFPPNTTIQAIVDELLIEKWIGASNYSAFYAQCRPSMCSYSYVSRAGFASVLAAIIALFGGLSVGTKTVAPILIVSYQRIKKMTSRKPSEISSNSNYSTVSKCFEQIR